MIISSWNVNSVRARIENITDYLKKFSPDIIMMQEIKTEDQNFPYDDFKKLKYDCHVFGQFGCPEYRDDVLLPRNVIFGEKKEN